MADDLCEVVITAPDPEWLAAFTRRLVEDGLCACGQVIVAVRSIYRWKGEVLDEAEARVALHTRTALVAEIVRRTLEEHPYDEPGICCLPITDGSPTYLQWIRDETQGGQGAGDDRVRTPVRGARARWWRCCRGVADGASRLRGSAKIVSAWL